jgi:hypothetical protein
MIAFIEASKSYVSRIGDLPAIAFEADDDLAFIQLLRETMNAVESLQDLDGRVAIDFIRPCPSSNDLRQLAARFKGGFGSSEG